MYSMILLKKAEISEESNTCQPLFSLAQKAQRKPTSQGSVTKKKRRGNFSRSAEREEGSAPSTHLGIRRDRTPFEKKRAKTFLLSFLKGARGKLSSKKVSLAPIFIYSFSG